MLNGDAESLAPLVSSNAAWVQEDSTPGLLIHTHQKRIDETGVKDEAVCSFLGGTADAGGIASTTSAVVICS